MVGCGRRHGASKAGGDGAYAPGAASFIAHFSVYTYFANES